MPGVAVVTDSTSYLPQELLDTGDVRIVSLYINWPDGTSEREADMPGFDGFYERLRAARDLPTTSQPSIGDFLDVYEPLLAEGNEIVSVHISGGISGTVETARQAAEQAGGDRITVIDSRTTAGGLGCLIVAAAAAARSGRGRQATVDRVHLARDALKIWFAVDTLDFFERGGRIGKAQAMLGSALKIKPILSIESEIVPIERVRTSSRAFDRLVDYMRARKGDGADGWVIQHIQSPDMAERLVDAGRELFGTEPVFVSEVGPVLGTHAGPGMLGVGGCPRSLMT